MTIEITTPRLILRTPTLADGPMIVAAMKEVWHELQKWMSWAHDGADTIESLRGHFLAKAEDDGSLIGLCRTSGRFVVSTGINPHGQAGRIRNRVLGRAGIFAPRLCQRGDERCNSLRL